VTSNQTSTKQDSRVYSNLDDLVRLRYQASGFSFLPRQPVHSILSGRHASRLRGRGLNFEELRNYLPGDDIRNIDWKVTARTQKPHVRVYTEEKDRPVWLLVDQRMSMFFGSKWKMKSTIAAEAAAISAWRVLSGGDRVGAIVFNDEQRVTIQPHRSDQRVMQILKQLVEFNQKLSIQSPTKPSEGMLDEALNEVLQFAKHDCLVIIISDGTGLNPLSRKRITQLSQHNDLLFAYVYDPLEQQIPRSGPLWFTDGSNQLELDSSKSLFGQSYTNDFDENLERMKTVSRQYSIPLLPCSTERSVLEQVREQLGHH
jgi:uncharacterized protein (DUF58 family)